jgi:hypothetical protein
MDFLIATSVSLEVHTPIQANEENMLSLAPPSSLPLNKASFLGRCINLVVEVK